MTNKVKRTKKYQLHGSYFKCNRMLNLPDTILEIAEYEKANGELPFAYSGSNWMYDAFCERQKYRGVYRSQFLTPDDTAYRMIQLAKTYFQDRYVLTPCCGTGQISKELHKAGYAVNPFCRCLIVSIMRYSIEIQQITKTISRNLLILTHKKC